LYHYYIYYRVADKNAGEVELHVRSMQARLACRSGVPGQLLKKRGDPGLWMEVYAQVAEPQAFERLLDQAVDEFDIAMFLDSPRKLECFTGDTPAAPACTRPR
jgi:hypothetical protein